MKLNKWGNEKFICILVVVFIMLSPIKGSQKKGDIPTEVNIDFDKKDVLPGEKMVITLSGFKDFFKHPANKGFWVIVKVPYGKILNGSELKKSAPEVDSELDIVPLTSRKAFRIGGENGNGTVKILYKASLVCPENEEFINVSSIVHINDEIPSDNIAIHQIIGEKKITYQCPDYLILTRSEHSQFDDGYQSRSMEFEVKLRVIIKPIKGINSFRIHSTDVIGFKGKKTYKSSDEDKKCRLSSAVYEDYLNSIPDDIKKKYLAADKNKPASYNKLVSGMLWPGSESETYRGITIPPFLIKLTWAGDQPYGPEKTVVGPVTKMKKPDNDPSLQNLKDLRNKMKGKDQKDIGKILSSVDFKNLMGNLENMVVHPDHKATFGDMRTNFSGGGELKKIYEDGYVVKKYSWEIFLNKK
jgi:hypothetical protein